MIRTLRKPGRKIPWAGILFGLMFIVLAASVTMNWNKAQSALRRADWRMLWLAALSSLLSVLSAGGAFAVVSRAFGLTVSRIRLLMVGFVNMGVNHILNLGGTAGYSVSALLLKQKNVEQRVVLAAYLFHYYLYFLVGSSMVPISVAYLALSRRIPGQANFGLFFLAAATLVFAMLVNLVVFRHATRQGLVRILDRAVTVVLHRNIGHVLERFDATLYQGIEALRVRPGRILALAGLVLGDWVFCLAALWSSFRSIGGAPSAGILFSGFFVGTAAGAVSMVPGGLGVQEGSMAGIYVLLGSPLQIAALGSILFRVVYYFVPLIAGLVVYWLAL